MKIGTIGAGPFAQAFAKLALKAGHKVTLKLFSALTTRAPGARAATSWLVDQQFLADFLGRGDC